MRITGSGALGSAPIGGLIGVGIGRMFTIFGAVRAYILADAQIADLIGTRFYRLEPPIGVTYPAVSMFKVSGRLESVLTGQASLARPRYQIDVWADGDLGYNTARYIGGLIQNRIDMVNATLVIGEAPLSTAFVQMAFDADREVPESPLVGGVYHYSADYFINHPTRDSLGAPLK